MTKGSSAASIVLLLFSTWNLKSELFVRSQWKAQQKQQQQNELKSNTASSSNGGAHKSINERPFISLDVDNPRTHPQATAEVEAVANEEPSEEEEEEEEEEVVTTPQKQKQAQKPLPDERLKRLAPARVSAPAPAPPPKPDPKATPSKSSSSSMSFQHKFHVDKIPEKQGSMSDECNKATDENPCLVETQYTYGTFSPQDYGFYVNRKHPEIVNPGQPYQKDDEWVWPAKDQTHAVCVLMELGGKNKQGGPKGWQLLDDTPHHLQELYRCINWWLSANPSQKPVLITPAPKDAPKQSQYIKSYYNLLEQVLGVEIHYNGAILPKGQLHVNMGAPLGHFSRQIGGYVINADAADAFLAKMMKHLYNNKNRRENQLRAGCPTSKKKTSGAKPKIWLVNREGSRRLLENHAEILQALQAAFPVEEGYEPIQYQPSFSGMTTEQQMKFMAQADIVVGPHGQQFMSVPFMPKCGGLVEFFVKGYHMPNFFGSLAAATGHNHYFSYNGGISGMTTLKEGRIVPSYRVSTPHAVELVQRAVESWNSCCQHGFRNS